MKPKILFISNKRSLPYTDDRNQIHTTKLSSGLSNSVNFVVDMLENEGYDCKYIQVNDGNDIDRVVTKEKPNLVILEAIWITPKKMEELAKLHKKIKWVIRIHSEIPFLSNEGNAIDWLIKFSNINNHVFIGANSDRAKADLGIVIEKDIFYLPNYYPVDIIDCEKKPIGNHIDIGCFGAIRPMKNQLLQAVAAIKFAKEIGKPLRFHININREETGGNNVLKNIRALFDACDGELVEHPWADHHDFIKILNKIDIGMQASLSETYNIVSADMVNKCIPVVVSNEIRWARDEFKVNPTSCDELVKKLHYCYKNRGARIIRKNKEALADNSKKAICAWKCFLKEIDKKN